MNINRNVVMIFLCVSVDFSQFLWWTNLILAGSYCHAAFFVLPQQWAITAMLRSTLAPIMSNNQGLPRRPIERHYFAVYGTTATAQYILSKYVHGATITVKLIISKYIYDATVPVRIIIISYIHGAFSLAENVQPSTLLSAKLSEQSIMIERLLETTQTLSQLESRNVYGEVHVSSLSLDRGVLQQNSHPTLSLDDQYSTSGTLIPSSCELTHRRRQIGRCKCLEHSLWFRSERLVSDL